MATKRTQKTWTAAQIKEHIRKIQELIEQQKRLVKKGEGFIAVTPEDIERKLKRTNSPFAIGEFGSWTVPTPLGGTFTYNIDLYNPDPFWAQSLHVHVWVGSGNVDPTTGTFLLNVDARFPRLTYPGWPSLALAPGTSTRVNFSMQVPSTVERTSYLGNYCLMKLNWFDVGAVLDRGGFAFTVS